MARQPGSLDHRLRVAGVVFATGSAIHIVDHLRRGRGSVSDTLLALGNAALVLQVITITLIATRHRLAPTVAAVIGPSLAIGFLAAHWLPHWSAASDPMWEITSLRWLSVIASIWEIVGALMVGVIGVSTVMRLRHPAHESSVTGPNCMRSPAADGSSASAPFWTDSP
jgi:hypothetical protein